MRNRVTYVLELDITMGKSYAVIFREETCLWEDTITHTKTGFFLSLIGDNGLV